jgi:hypothetical protein
MRPSGLRGVLLGSLFATYLWKISAEIVLSLRKGGRRGLNALAEGIALYKPCSEALRVA